jgi:hypothetical protein
VTLQPVAQGWERWTKVSVGNGRIALLSFHGNYLSAWDDGRVVLAPHVKGWEEWTEVRNGDGSVSFRSHRGTYLSAWPDGSVKHCTFWPTKLYLYCIVQYNTVIYKDAQKYSSCVRKCECDASCAHCQRCYIMLLSLVVVARAFYPSPIDCYVYSIKEKVKQFPNDAQIIDMNICTRTEGERSRHSDGDRWPMVFDTRYLYLLPLMIVP